MSYLHGPKPETNFGNEGIKGKSIDQLINSEYFGRNDYPPFVWKDNINFKSKWGVAQMFGITDETVIDQKVHGKTRYWLPEKKKYTISTNEDIPNHETVDGLVRYYFFNNTDAPISDKQLYKLRANFKTKTGKTARKNEKGTFELSGSVFQHKPENLVPSESYADKLQIEQLTNKNQKLEEKDKKNTADNLNKQVLERLNAELTSNALKLFAQESIYRDQLLEYEESNFLEYQNIMDVGAKDKGANYYKTLDKFIFQTVKTAVGDIPAYKMLKDIGKSNKLLSVLNRSAWSMALSFVLKNYLFKPEDKSGELFKARTDLIKEILSKKDHTKFAEQIVEIEKNLNDQISKAKTGSLEEKKQQITELNEAFKEATKALEKLNATMLAKNKSNDRELAANLLEEWVLNNAGTHNSPAQFDKNGNSFKYGTQWYEALEIVTKYKKNKDGESYSMDNDSLSKSQNLPLRQLKRQCEIFGLHYPKNIYPLKIVNKAIEDKKNLPQDFGTPDDTSPSMRSFNFRRKDIIPGNEKQFAEQLAKSYDGGPYGLSGSTYTSIDDVLEDLKSFKPDDIVFQLKGRLNVTYGGGSYSWSYFNYFDYFRYSFRRGKETNLWTYSGWQYTSK